MLAIFNNIKYPILSEISDSINNIALADFNKSIEINPKDELLYYQIGITKIRMSNYADAIFYFSKAIEINPRYYEAYLKRGKCLQIIEEEKNLSIDSTNWAVGIPDYSMAININPNYADAYIERATAKQLQHNYLAALSDYDKIIDIAPNDSRGLYKSLEIRSNILDDNKSALEDYNKLVRIEYNSNSYSGRASVKEKLGDNKGAIEDYSIAIRLNNKDKDLYFNRARIKSKLQDYRGAILDYNEAILLDNKFSYAYFNRGNVKCNLNDYKGAILDYNKVIEIGSVITEKINIMGVSTIGTRIVFSDNCLLYINRGKAKYNLNDKNGACLDWSKASEFECGEEDVYALIKEYCN
jgi:tetratricopeptide (TPR) repeat protein